MAAATSCLKRRTYHVLSNVTYSPSHRQAGAPMINIQLTLRTSTYLSKNVSLAELFGSDGNSYTVSTHSDMCIYSIHIFQNMEKLLGKKNLKKWDKSESRLSRKPFHAPQVRQSCRTVSPNTRTQTPGQPGSISYVDA